MYVRIRSGRRVDRRKLIIDADPGIDDAVAIMLANGSHVFDILGITAVYGSASLNQTARNTLYLADLYDIGCKVAIGAKQAILKSIPFDETPNGKNGLGNYVYPQLGRKPYDRWAWELIYEAALECEGELEILTLGPLTNIAIAVLRYPLLKDLVKRIVIMGGSSEIGDVSPYAEFNMMQDAHAASIVMEAGFHDLVMVDLMSCMTAYLTDIEADRFLIQKSKLGPLYETMRRYQRKVFRDYLEEFPLAGEYLAERNVFCGAVAAAVAVDQSISAVEPCYVAVETRSAVNYGQTIIDRHGRFNKRANVSLAAGADRNSFYTMLFNALDSYLPDSGAEKGEENG